MRLLKELWLTILGIISLFWPWTTVKPFANDDYVAELKTNTSLAKKPDEEIAKLRQAYEPEVKQRFKSFRRIVWGSFWFLVTAIIVALFVAPRLHVSPGTRTLLGALSIFVFAWATLARLGRSSMSMGGETALERVDLRVLWILYWIGTLIGTLAIV